MAARTRRVVARRAARGEVVDARVIDLDAARVARAEAAGSPATLKFGGKEYTLPAEVPVLAALAYERGDVETAIRALLGDAADDFFASASLQDVEAFSEGYGLVYGLSEGE